MKVYVDGAENIRWAIDSNRENLQRSLKRQNIIETKSVWKTDIVHNLVWNQLFCDRLLKGIYKFVSARRNNILVSALSFMDPSNPQFYDVDLFQKVNSIAHSWIVPSRMQQKVFSDNHIRAQYLPLLVDTKLFQPRKRDVTKREICERHGIPYDLIKDKVILGSFQRDSLGEDLKRPKWQKGADILIDLVSILPREKYVLLLTSPRRHYVIHECRKKGLPYFYLGKETDEDDLILNNHEHETIADLYGLLDVYLITSRLEGGPTAVVETTASKTFVLSTDVGMAADYIQESCVFNDTDDYKKRLLNIVENYQSNIDFINDILDRQYQTCMSLSSDEAVDEKIINIYNQVLVKRASTH